MRARQGRYRKERETRQGRYRRERDKTGHGKQKIMNKIIQIQNIQNVQEKHTLSVIFTLSCLLLPFFHILN